MQNRAPLFIAALLTCLFACASHSAPDADALYQEWRKRVDAAQVSAPADNATFETELLRRVDVEQEARMALAAIQASDAPPEVREEAMRLAWVDLNAIYRDNLNFLLPNIPEDGWFRKSKTDPKVSYAAWLIIQHTPDPALQARVLAAMERLLAEGETSGVDYAYFYDRVQMERGAPQRYGTQYTCSNGAWSMGAVEAPDEIEALRRGVGFKETHEEYMEQNQTGTPCL